MVLLEPFWIAKSLYLWICGFTWAFLDSKKPLLVDLWFYLSLFGLQKIFTYGFVVWWSLDLFLNYTYNYMIIFLDRYICIHASFFKTSKSLLRMRKASSQCRACQSCCPPQRFASSSSRLCPICQRPGWQ